MNPAPLTQLFLASTPLEVVFLAAGIDSGAYDSCVQPALIRSSDDPEPIAEPIRRVLLLSDNAEILEQATPLHAAPGLTPTFTRFDDVVTLNVAIAPAHPNTWKPREEDLQVFERLLRSHWQLGESRVELVLESPQVNPAIALARIFGSALIRVSADGLMSYGPTRSKLPLSMKQRMTSLHYVSLVDDLEPRLLHETGIVPLPLPVDALRNAIAEVGAGAADLITSAVDGLDGPESGLVIGQYCASLGLISENEETELHCQMADSAAAEGCRTIAFKPHPAAPAASISALRDHVEARGLKFVQLDCPVIAEAIIAALQPRVLVSAFSTSLVLADRLFSTTTRAVGTRLLLERLSPYQNSNRVPLTIIDLLTHPTNGIAMQQLIDAVSYCMQAQLLPSFRDRTAAFLRDLSEEARSVYFKRRRLTVLDLPGRLPERHRARTVIRQSGRLGAGYLVYRTKRVLRRVRVARARSGEGRRG
ncbi:polysialyltransferase family glycosyltransferase [Brevibacterium luteolum]|uniref:polysialyltransferase family glycosyltransferase n=1 Tax=Brevibacterium luteolum TaxID=199591 RepID=UPI003B673C3A